MHFVFSYDIKDSSEIVRNQITEEIKAALKPHSWVRPLTTFYIVKVKAAPAWNDIRSRLVEVAKNHPKKLNFVMSPLMQGGTYNGWLPQDMWSKIRERATP